LWVEIYRGGMELSGEDWLLGDVWNSGEQEKHVGFKYGERREELKLWADEKGSSGWAGGDSIESCSGLRVVWGWSQIGPGEVEGWSQIGAEDVDWFLVK
jgi:hypothetical protein